TSRPFNATVSGRAVSLSLGTSISTRTSPPLTRSGRVDRVVTVSRVRPAAATAPDHRDGPVPIQPARAERPTMPTVAVAIMRTLRCPGCMSHLSRLPALPPTCPPAHQPFCRPVCRPVQSAVRLGWHAGPLACSTPSSHPQGIPAGFCHGCAVAFDDDTHVPDQKTRAAMTPVGRRPWRGLGVLGLLVGHIFWNSSPGLSLVAGAEALPTPVGYTQARAEQGQSVYTEQCASCHGGNLDDGEFGPPLKGIDFRERWGGKPPDALFSLVSTRMPPARPGTLGDQAYARLLAYILQENGTQPGTRELSADADVLKTLAPPVWPRLGGGGLSPRASGPPSPAELNPPQEIPPRAEAMLAQGAHRDRLSRRQTHKPHG